MSHIFFPLSVNHKWNNAGYIYVLLLTLIVLQQSEYGRLKQQWEIARKDVRLVDLVAKGSFVEIWRGRMRKYPRRNEIMKVAIKRIICEYRNKDLNVPVVRKSVFRASHQH